MESIKLQKYFTDCGVLSRRAAEKAIQQGLVTVNGSAATLGMRIDPQRDTVSYRGHVLTLPQQEKICLLLHKPRGYITTLSDDRGRHTVAELVANAGRRLYPIGRLDMDSEGLLLLTDDGALANRLTHPKHEIPKHYQVTVRGSVSPEALLRLNRAMTLDGYTILPVQTRILSASDTETVLSFRLYEGRNRQIRKMCALAGLHITRLCRVAIGELTLGTLPPGKWRSLTADELAYLRGERASLLNPVAPDNSEKER